MKTVIVSLASQYVHSTLAPWYLFYTVRELLGSGTEVKVLEGTVNENEDDLAQRISTEKADLIAFSGYIWNITLVKRLAERLKSSGAKILLGGPEVSYNPDELLSNDFVDFIISGEGERPFAELLNALQNDSDLSKISGLCYKAERGMVINSPNTSVEIPVCPYGEEFLNSLGGRIVYLETSRGCPFSCAFCLSGRLGGVRFFPLDRAKNDILTLAKSGSKIVKFVDRTFNANRQRAFEIWQFIIENYGKKIPRGVCFHFEIAGDLLKDEDFGLLKTAPKGAIQFEIGIQSFNPKTLEAINRKTNTERLYENIKKLCDLGNIHIHIDLIAGLPMEDYESFRSGFNKAFYLGADMLQLGFLKLLHGADMRRFKEKYPLEFSKNPPYEVASTPWLSADEIKSLHYTENALDRFVGSGRFTLTNNLIFKGEGLNPFDTLTALGRFTDLKSCPLNDYVEKVYNFFGADTKTLRDALVLDIASSVKSGSLPKCLTVPDKALREFKKQLELNPETKKKKGVLRCVFWLYGENCGGYVDYDEKQNGKYIVHKIYPADFL